MNHELPQKSKQPCYIHASNSRKVFIPDKERLDLFLSWVALMKCDPDTIMCTFIFTYSINDTKYQTIYLCPRHWEVFQHVRYDILGDNIRTL